MGDDAIALKVAEKLKEELEEMGIVVIIGETDLDYCLEKMSYGDYIIILDATWFGKEIGTISNFQLNNINENNLVKDRFSQHGYSLLNAIINEKDCIDGVLIGIEGKEYNFSTELSDILKIYFEPICKTIIDIIQGYLSIKGVKKLKELEELKE
jgi:hydrogenase maturation protease